MTTPEMAEAAGKSQPLGVTPHRNLLEKHGYLIRKNYERWMLNSNALQLPLLTAILSYQVELYKDKDGVVKARKRA